MSGPTIVGLLAALDLFVRRNPEDDMERLADLVERLAVSLAGLKGWRIEQGLARGTRPPAPMLYLCHPGGPAEGAPAVKNLIFQLRSGSPPIHVDETQWRDGQLGLNPICLQDAEIDLLSTRLHELCG